jgi:hypothetical protein
MATVIGEPSVTILTVERSPESNGSAQAAACGVASCASATRRFERAAAAATPAAAPETNFRRLREDPLILSQMFIDVHLLQRRRFDGPMTLRHALLRACTIH